MRLDQLLKVAINASIKGGKKIMEVYKSDFDVEWKKDKSPLTLADKTCNDAIEHDLKRTRIPILSEEGAKIPYSERKRWTYFWLVDPLDGTKEFIKRNGEFTVNIALISKRIPIMGVIYVPVTKELYFSSRDIGMSFKKSNISSPIVSLKECILESDKLPLSEDREFYTIVGSRSHMSLETKEFFKKKKHKYRNVNIIEVGSSLKLCMLAEGKADAYPRYAPTMEWDTAAGHAIAKYAGVSVKQYGIDKELLYNKKDLLNPWFLAE